VFSSIVLKGWTSREHTSLDVHSLSGEGFRCHGCCVPTGREILLSVCFARSWGVYERRLILKPCLSPASSHLPPSPGSARRAASAWHPATRPSDNAERW